MKKLRNSQASHGCSLEMRNFCFYNSDEYVRVNKIINIFIFFLGFSFYNLSSIHIHFYDFRSQINIISFDKISTTFLVFRIIQPLVHFYICLLFFKYFAKKHVSIDKKSTLFSLSADCFSFLVVYTREKNLLLHIILHACLHKFDHIKHTRLFSFDILLTLGKRKWQKAQSILFVNSVDGKIENVTYPSRPSFPSTHVRAF